MNVELWCRDRQSSAQADLSAQSGIPDQTPLGGKILAVAPSEGVESTPGEFYNVAADLNEN